MKHKNLYPILGILLLALSNVSHGQQFTKTYGGANLDLLWGMQPAADEGYVMYGFSSSPFGLPGAGAYLVRTDRFGDTLWTRVFTGVSSCLHAAQTPDAGYVVTGGTYASGAGSQDGYFARLDGNGNILWAKTYGGAGNDELICAVPAFDGGYLLCGSTSSFGAGSFDIYLIRTNDGGDTLWTRTYGGADEDAAMTMQKTPDDAYIICGQTKSYGAGQDDALLLKIDKDGNVIWTKTYGGVEADVATSVAVTADSGYIFTGKTHSYGAVSNDGDVLLVRTNRYGDTQWARTYGGYGTDWGHAVIQTRDGGFAVAGDTWAFGAGENDIYLLKTDADGALQWSYVHGGDVADNAVGIQQAADGGYMVACFTESMSTSMTDYCLIKTDSTGRNDCHEGIAGTVVTAPTLNIGSPFVDDHSPNTQVSAVTLQSARGGTVTSLCAPPTAVQQAAEKSMSISPNPSDGHFTIAVPGSAAPGAIYVTNMTGETVLEIPVKSAGLLDVDAALLPPGMYFVKPGSAGVAPQKIVIRH